MTELLRLEGQGIRGLAAFASITFPVEGFDLQVNLVSCCHIGARGDVEQVMHQEVWDDLGA